MKSKPYFLMTVLYLGLSLSMNALAKDDDDFYIKFKKAKFEECDKVELETTCQNMMCTDNVVNQQAECWRRSMNSVLDKRLLKLKSTDQAQYDSEMQLQKTFNQAVTNVCGKDCGGSNEPTVGMRGIPYNNCRIEAYKYRTTQAILMNMNQLSIYERSTGRISVGAHGYNSFADQLCKMPADVWKDHKAPADCRQKTLEEINSARFSDDVCDLS